MRFIRSLYVALIASALAGPVQAADLSLLNGSYDPTRELYQDFNKSFATVCKSQTGGGLKITQSQGGSGKQARAVIDGLAAGYRRRQSA